MSSHAPALSARSVCFAYQHEDVLHDVSATMRFGEVTAIVGANGSGKSTLIELLAGVRRTRRGAVSREADVALVVQRPQVSDGLPVTARDVVEMGTWGPGPRLPRVRRRAAVERALARVGMGALAARPFAGLSGGQRQRTLLAQGIVRDARILLLDEPAASLDDASRARTRDILAEEAARGAAVICVTHDADATASADRVIRLENGRVRT
jgi:zinc/manganese transport system ATP-binding protein